MTQLDLFFIIFIGLTILASIRAGLLKTLLDLFLIIFSVYFATYLAEVLSGTHSGNLSFIYFFAVSWVVSYCILSVIAFLLHKVIKISLLGPVDLFGGLILGVVKGIMILGVLIWVLESLPLGANFKMAVTKSFGKKVATPVISFAYNATFNNLPNSIKIIEPKSTLPFIEKKMDKKEFEKVLPEIKKEAQEKIINEVEKIN